MAQTTLTIYAEFEVTCENCGLIYTTFRSHEHTSSGIGGDPAELEKTVNNQMHLLPEPKKCPKCGFLQYWMWPIISEVYLPLILIICLFFAPLPWLILTALWKFIFNSGPPGVMNWIFIAISAISIIRFGIALDSLITHLTHKANRRRFSPILERRGMKFVVDKLGDKVQPDVAAKMTTLDGREFNSVHQFHTAVSEIGDKQLTKEPLFSILADSCFPILAPRFIGLSNPQSVLAKQGEEERKWR